MSTTPLEAEIADLIRRNIDGHNDQVCLRSDCPDSLPARLAAREREAAERGAREVRQQVESVVAARGTGDFSPMIPKLREIATAGGEPE